MLAFMLYATIIGVLFAGAAAVVEALPVLSARKRMLWLVAIAGTIVMSGAAVMTSTKASRVSDAGNAQVTQPLPAARTPVSTTTIPVRQGVASAPDESVAASPSLGADAGLLLLWILGTIACVALLGTSAWRVSRMRSAWREQVIAGVPVLVSHDVGPAVIGLVHHEIVVPAWVETLDEPAQRTIMTHEREHLRAGDPLLLWGATLLVSLMPWNAPLWYALRRLRHAIEMDCDARVLQARVDPRAYCTLLLDVVERTLAGVAPVAALAEPSTMIERRIDAMTRTARTASWKVYLAGAAAAALVVAACYTPRPELAPRARAHELIGELASLMKNDSVASSITPAERQQLASAAGSKPLMFENKAGSAATTEAPRMSGALSPQPRRAIELYYPGLGERSDTTQVVIALVYGADGKLKAHDLRKITDPHYSSGTHIEHSSIELHHELNATILVAIEARNQPSKVDPSDFPDVGAVLLTHLTNDAIGRVTDSIIAKDFPEARTMTSGALIIVVIYSPDGRLLEKFAKAVTHDAVFKPNSDHIRDDLTGNDMLALGSPHPLDAMQMLIVGPLDHAPRVVVISAVTMGATSRPVSRSAKEASSPYEGMGMRVDSIARADFPEAYRPMEDGMIIGVIFNPDFTVKSKFAKHVALSAIFRPNSSYPGQLESTIHDGLALLSLASDGKLPKLLMAASQVMRAAPHAILAMGVAEK
ncbi:MAG: peptidase BlaR1 [Gemmatimonadetes bacterium]|nr:peptidase BlaR1 [Gemmatimonadota bacterium]